MLLQTNSYVVPKDKRAEHGRLMRRFRQVLGKLGCDQFEIYEQVGANWNGTDGSGRFVQLMRFRDRKHQLAVQNAEKSDPAAQALISEFCELVNFPYQQQQGYFAVGFYTSVLPALSPRAMEGSAPQPQAALAGPVEADELAGDGEMEAVADADEPPAEQAVPVAEPEQWLDEEIAPEASESAAGSTDHSAAMPQTAEDILNFDRPGEPLSEEELERQMAEETPPPAAAPPAPATRTGLFRRK